MDQFHRNGPFPFSDRRWEANPLVVFSSRRVEALETRPFLE